MSRESRMFAGILLIVLPSVMYGGLTLLGMLTGNTPGYYDNPLRQNLWRAGHAHAGVYLVLSLVMLRDEAALSPFWKWLAPDESRLCWRAISRSVRCQPRSRFDPCGTSYGTMMRLGGRSRVASQRSPPWVSDSEARKAKEVDSSALLGLALISLTTPRLAPGALFSRRFAAHTTYFALRFPKRMA
jgi:hypothetical protein